MKLHHLLIVAAFGLICLGAGGARADVGEQNDAPQPVSEEPIKLVHVLNPGEREYLSPNLIGLQNIAQTFLPLSMNLVNVIDAYREVVNGVRYDISVNALDTRNKDAEVVCHIIVLEKPWLLTHWGDKVRELTYSNCTEEAAGNSNKDQRDQYESNELFNGGKRTELSEQDMDKLNSEILTSSSTSTTTTTTEAAAITASNGEEEPFTALPELSDDEKKWLDGFLLAGAKNFENSRRQNQDQDEGEPDYHHQQESNALKRAALLNAQEQEQQAEAAEQQQQQQQVTEF